MILALDPDPEAEFQLGFLVIPDPDSVKSGIITPTECPYGS